MPLIILGGRDLKVTTLPEGGRDKSVLRGYKAVDLKIGGRRLIDILIDRAQASGFFDPIYIAGPSAIYEDLAGAEIIETDGNLAENLAACVDAMARLQPGRQVMFTTCDILPDPDELAAALQDFHSHQPLDYWMAQIREPENVAELGESQWKPKYFLHPTGEAQRVQVLPGHILAVDPGIADTDLIIRFFGGLYKTRNRSIGSRYGVIARLVLGKLFSDDFKALLRLRPPSRTWTVVYNCLLLARRLAAGVARQDEFEVRIRRIFLKPDHVRAHPENLSRVAIIPGLSLAKDIDTEEEAREVARAAEADS